MVFAWFMDNSPGDQRLPHKPDKCETLSLDVLASLGVLYWKLNANEGDDNEQLNKIRSERGYNYKDVITVSPEKLPNYEEKIKVFFEEHLHTDEEIRFILEGSGYFDVRDSQDRWIRIEVVKGDLIVLPAGIYHRFTLDTGNYIKAMRLFQGEPVWTPVNRPADSNPARINYMSKFNK